MHGDALCTDDRAYQRLRATVRDADWQRRFLALSVAQRRALAGAARSGSQAHTASLNMPSPMSTPRASPPRCAPPAQRRCCTDTRTGPASIPSSVDGRACTRIVLGDWYTQGSVLRWDRAVPSCRRCRGRPCRRPADAPNESEIAASGLDDQLRLELRERLDRAADVDAGARPPARRARSRYTLKWRASAACRPANSSPSGTADAPDRAPRSARRSAPR